MRARLAPETMARTEKKTDTPRLRAVKPTDASPDGDDTASTAASTPASSTKTAPPRPSEEVQAARRRTFTAEFKRRVLAEVEACTESGDIGAVLRRHGLYSSHLTEWRRQREEGALAGLAPRKRGRKTRERNPLSVEVVRLQGENRKLLARAERAERLVELQKKVAELLGDPLPPPPPDLMPEPPLARTRRRR